MSRKHFQVSCSVTATTNFFSRMCNEHELLQVYFEQFLSSRENEFTKVDKTKLPFYLFVKVEIIIDDLKIIITLSYEAEKFVSTEKPVEACIVGYCCSAVS